MPTLMRSLYRLAGGGLALGLLLYPFLAHTFAGGAPAGFNGSPPMNVTCVACHAGAEPNSGTGSLEIEAPGTFAPGEALELRVVLENTTEPAEGREPRQGFLLSVHDAESGEHAGRLVVLDPATTQIAQGDEHFLTHTKTGTTVSEWTVRWEAPEEAPEAVTIYVAANAANGDEMTGGDFIYATTATLARSGTSAEATAPPLAARIEAVFPNPVRDAATVAYALERPGPVTLRLFDGRGRALWEAALGAQAAGRHTAALEAGGLASGVYFLEVVTPGATDVRPLTVAR